MSGTMADAGAERRGPLACDDEGALAALRQALAAADFTVEQVEATLGVRELSARAADAAVHLRRLAGDGPFSTLARLFLVGVPVGAEEAQAALAPLSLSRLAALGLADVHDGSVQAGVRLVPHGDYYVVSDRHESLLDTRPDFVAGIHGPSVTLAKLAVRREVGAALDLGTGCGIQALLAARHAGRVVATDANPRALNFGAFNARLNGVEAIEFRAGDTFTPVEGERFDLVVSNPPYVISPDMDLAYRDSGRPGDEFSREIVRRVPEFLNEGGFAHVLVSWAQEPDGDWAEPLRRWVDGCGCDAWLLHYKTDDPITHAASWLAPLADEDASRYEDALDRWLAYLRRLGIEAIGYGAVVLRRRRGANWVRADELPLDRLEPASEHTLRVFAGQDELAGLRDAEELLGRRFALVERHRIEQMLRCREGALVVESQTLELEDGLRFRAGVDRYTGALLPHLDGTRPLGKVLERLAADLGLDEADAARFVPAALPVVRRLLELGFLVRAA